MKKVRPVVARNAQELVEGLGSVASLRIAGQIPKLNDKIIEVGAKKGLTDVDVKLRVWAFSVRNLNQNIALHSHLL